MSIGCVSRKMQELYRNGEIIFSVGGDVLDRTMDLEEYLSLQESLNFITKKRLTM